MAKNRRRRSSTPVPQAPVLHELATGTAAAVVLVLGSGGAGFTQPLFR